jgi:MFS transporter, ACS family, solute carrier family 17 (sodium-dependent inorganic phosphate cotransporter), other
LVSRWAPKDEKGKFISALLGGALGNVITWVMLGPIIKTFGWQFGFYIPALITLVFVLMWYILVADSPADHSSISKKEREYIQDSLGDSVSKSKSLPPVLSVLSSIPFYALLILHYGSLWGLYFLQTAAPMFMTEALKFDLSAAGNFSSLPPLARLLAGFGFGAIGDFIRRRNFMKVTIIRKSFCLFCKYN